jgi:hypothetical protein
MYVALGILLNLREHYEERASYGISASVATVSGWKKNKTSTLHGVYYKIIIVFKTGGEMSKGGAMEFNKVECLDEQLNEFDPFYSIFAFTVFLRWTQKIFPDNLKYMECKGNEDSCLVFACSRSQRQYHNYFFSQEEGWKHICKEMTHNWLHLHAKVCGGQFKKSAKFLVKSLPRDHLRITFRP